MTRIGLVLGAGGVVGHAWHTGVLQALEAETGWDPRHAAVIVGTSAGSIVGASLRADVTTGQMGSPRNRGPAIPDAPPRVGLPTMSAPGVLLRSALQPWRARLGIVTAAALPAGRVSTEVVVAGFREVYGDQWPDRPLFLNAVRLDTGRRVTFGRDGAPRTDVATAVAASVAIPGFFAPVTIDGARYVDGGAHSPTNADVLVDQAVDLVVVSSPMSVAGNGMRPAPDLPPRRLAAFYLAREIAQLRRRGIEVLAFQPHGDDRATMGFNAMDPSRRDRVTEQAQISARRRLARPDVAARVASLRAAARA